MKKVLILQRIVPDYRISFFRGLNDLLAQRGIELEVLAGQPWPGENFIDARKELSFITSTNNTKLFSAMYWLKGALKKSYSADLIIFEQANVAAHTYPLLISRLLGLGERRLAFWGHGANLNERARNSFKHRWKKFWMTRVDHWFAYTELSGTIIRDSGFSENKITLVQNAIDTGKLRDALNELPDNQRNSGFKKLFGEDRLPVHRIGVFCARLTPLKWIPFLLEVIKLVHAAYPGFRMIIIGEGPDRYLVEEFCSSNTWCKWVGAIHGEERVKYLALADLFLNPGMTGLSILDALTVGIPFLTTNCGIHSPEIAYLKPNQSGLLAEPVEAEFASAIVELIRDEPKLTQMKQCAFKDGMIYSVKNMVGNFAHGISEALKDHG